MDAQERQMKKSGGIEGRPGLRWAIKNQRVGKKVSAKAQCAQAEQGEK
jgi:hypothetical protein